MMPQDVLIKVENTTEKSFSPNRQQAIPNSKNWPSDFRYYLMSRYNDFENGTMSQKNVFFTSAYVAWDISRKVRISKQSDKK